MFENSFVFPFYSLQNVHFPFYSFFSLFLWCFPIYSLYTVHFTFISDSILHFWLFFHFTASEIRSFHFPGLLFFPVLQPKFEHFYTLHPSQLMDWGISWYWEAFWLDFKYFCLIYLNQYEWNPDISQDLTNLKTDMPSWTHVRTHPGHMQKLSLLKIFSPGHSGIVWFSLKNKCYQRFNQMHGLLI